MQKERIPIRLFIALNFSNAVKAQITEILQKVRAGSLQGRFVDEEQLHITLEFLGEIPPGKLPVLKKVLDGLSAEPFALSLTKVGFFRRPEGNTYWLGVEHSDALFRLQAQLHKSLLAHGFSLEERKFTPHITLGRNVLLRDDFRTDELANAVKETRIDIDKVDLMLSEFINRRPKYTVLHTKRLQQT